MQSNVQCNLVCLCGLWHRHSVGHMAENYPGYGSQNITQPVCSRGNNKMKALVLQKKTYHTRKDTFGN